TKATECGRLPAHFGMKNSHGRRPHYWIFISKGPAGRTSFSSYNVHTGLSAQQYRTRVGVMPATGCSDTALPSIFASTKRHDAWPAPHSPNPPGPAAPYATSLLSISPKFTTT